MSNIEFDANIQNSEYLKAMLDINPVTVPYSRPIYSQVSFTLIIFALGEVTGKNYSQLLDELVNQPFGLKNTGVSPGDDDKAVIPPGDSSSWGSDYGYNAP